MPYELFRTLYSHNPGIFIIERKRFFFDVFSHFFLPAIDIEFFSGIIFVDFDDGLVIFRLDLIYSKYC